MEVHRNYITRMRNDVSFSTDYEALEDVYVTIGTQSEDGKGNGTARVYKMLRKEEELLNTHMEARNNQHLFGKCNVDQNGKARNYDPATGRALVSGDGVINQVERYADKFAYTKMTTDVMDTVLSSMRQKSKNSMGNKYTIICNELLWDDIQRSLKHYLKDWRTNGVTMFSKTGKNVSIGSTFDSYTFGGNEVTFMVDKSLSLEYDTRPYGLCLDLTADLVAGKPAIAAYTLKGKEFKRNILRGVGSNGGEEISSPVAASRLIMTSYSCVCVHAPYRSFVIEGNKY